MFSFPLLLADIGGSNARFALCTSPSSALTLETIETKNFKSFEDACLAVIQKQGVVPSSMILCGAGPLRSPKLIQLTNASWVLDGEAIANFFSLKQGLLLNDFEAQAITLPYLKESALTAIPPLSASSLTGSTRLVLGAGTGLGISALIEASGKFIAIPSEAGHIDFAPTTPEEISIWSYLIQKIPRITPDILLSGRGLSLLHEARSYFNSSSTLFLLPQKITETALIDKNSEEANTIALFVNLLARFAGDMALVFNALGGVYFAGGILPRLTPLLNKTDFRTHFENKTPMSDCLSSIPCFINNTPSSLLEGLKDFSKNTQSFGLDYNQRMWV